MTDRFLQKRSVQALERCIDQTECVLGTHLDLLNANMTIAIQKAQIKGFKTLLAISLALLGIMTALIFIGI